LQRISKRKEKEFIVKIKVELKEGLNMLSLIEAEALLMHDGQCRTEVWIGEEDNTLEGVCYHHDAPTGSTFYIKGNK
jgi:hypothetical protein